MHILSCQHISLRGVAGFCHNILTARLGAPLFIKKGGIYESV